MGQRRVNTPDKPATQAPVTEVTINGNPELIIARLRQQRADLEARLDVFETYVTQLQTENRSLLERVAELEDKEN